VRSKSLGRFSLSLITLKTRRKVRLETILMKIATFFFYIYFNYKIIYFKILSYFLCNFFLFWLVNSFILVFILAILYILNKLSF